MSALQDNWWTSFFIRRLDLHFSDVLVENQFKQSLETRLLYVGLIIYTILIIGYVAEVLYGLRDDDSPCVLVADGCKMDSNDKPQLFRSVATFTCYLAIPLATGGLTLLRLKCSSAFKALDPEVLVVSGITFSSILVPWTMAWTVAHLFGQHPDEVWDHDTKGGESFSVLTLDAIATGVCLFVPLRMRFKLIPPVCGTISFIIYAVVISSPYPNLIAFNIFVLCGLVFCALCGAWQNEQVARQHFISQSIVRKSSRQLELQNASNSRILARLCDTLLHLDNNLHIIDPEPRFDALLLCRHLDNVRPRSFLDFLASDHDRALFTSALNTRISINGTINIMEEINNDGLVQVSLLDMHGREFSVYAYHASIYDIESKCGHMVALVEVHERIAPFPDVIQQQTIIPSEEREEGSGGNSGNKTFDNTSSGSEVPLPLIEGRFAEVAAWLDMSTIDLSIVQYSAGFTVFGPISEGASLTKMLDGRSATFRKWLEKMDNKFRNEEVLSESDACKVKLRPLQPIGVVFSAVCTLDCDSLVSIEEDHILPVLFSEVRCHYRRRPSEERAPVSMRNVTLRSPAISL